jgi:hypothetical protein
LPHTTPLVVTVAPPSDVIFPPELVPEVVIEETSTVVIVGKRISTLTVLDFLHADKASSIIQILKNFIFKI